MLVPKARGKIPLAPSSPAGAPSSVFPCPHTPGPVEQTEGTRDELVAVCEPQDTPGCGWEGSRSTAEPRVQDISGEHRHYLPVMGGSFRAPRAISSSSAAARASVGGGVGNGKLMT